MNIDLRQGDSAEILKQFPKESVDLVVTSPPYDNLRTYGNPYDFMQSGTFCLIADELTRVLKDGGVIIWVVGDATINGSETCTSFRQALYFTDECRLNLHDTMIYKKLNFMPQNHGRYEPCFEYMFCFSKGKPKTFNPIKVPCKYGGTDHWGIPTQYQADGSLSEANSYGRVKETKLHINVFEYNTGSVTESAKFNHPAMFPMQLATDQIISWSNPDDTVLDPFMGSGTTGVSAIKLHRNFIGIELSEEYFKMSKERIENTKVSTRLF